jgi:hypothetical protein
MAIKSLVTQVRVETVSSAHSCQANSKHRLQRGDVRLKVRNGRGWDHYCHACATAIITRDIAKLTALQSLTPEPVEN